MQLPIRTVPALVVSLLVAAACGGDADAGPAPGDYFAQLQRVSETAHIQERGLRRDLRLRLEEAAPREERLAAAMVYLDQGARLYRDIVDALGALDPPDELASPQQTFLEAWRSQLDLIVAVRDGRFRTADRILRQVESDPFRDAAAETRAACDALQEAVAAAGSDADLVCDGRPA